MTDTSSPRTRVEDHPVRGDLTVPELGVVPFSESAETTHRLEPPRT